jgi:hypothetical protein
VVLAKAVIDATGNADIAAAAGAATIYTDDTDIAVQGAGLPGFGVRPGHMNTDFTFVDETDMIDVWRLMVAAKARYRNEFDVAQFIDTRERRRIVGDYTLTILDAVTGRTYPDIIVTAQSDYDSHGYTVDPYFGLAHPGKAAIRTHVPYRCLLPKGLEGILAIGLGASAQRDVVPIIRMQADIQNQGYAAGVAAAMAVQGDITPRAIDVKRLQEHLVQVGNINRGVLTAVDSFPVPQARLRDAVAGVLDNYTDVGLLMAAREDALPLLREAYANATGEAALTYAHVLGMLNDPAGAPTLIAAIEATPWDNGWTYRAMGQYGPSLSRVDSLIIALGRTRDPRGTAAILAKARELTPTSAFSHHRAVALALESIGAREAAPVLAELLRTPGMTGHAMLSINGGKLGGVESDLTREQSLREIALARALYRCGDQDKAGEDILRQYTNDLRGHFVRHAAAVLAKGK